MNDQNRENLDRLFRLMDQLCAATIISGDEMFFRWNRKIQQDYLGIVDDLADNARRVIQNIHLL